MKNVTIVALFATLVAVSCCSSAFAEEARDQTNVYIRQLELLEGHRVFWLMQSEVIAIISIEGKTIRQPKRIMELYESSLEQPISRKLIWCRSELVVPVPRGRIHYDLIAKGGDQSHLYLITGSSHYPGLGVTEIDRSKPPAELPKTREIQWNEELSRMEFRLTMPIPPEIWGVTLEDQSGISALSATATINGIAIYVVCGNTEKWLVWDRTHKKWLRGTDPAPHLAP